MFIINFCLNMFRASLCPSSGEQRTRNCIWCIVLVLLDVVGSGCGALSSRVCTPFKTARHNRYQPHPAVLKEVSTMKSNRNLQSAHFLQDSAPTTTSRTRTIHQIQHQVLCSPEDGHNDARNMIRQKLIKNI